MLAVYLNFTYEIHTPTDVLQLGSPLKINDEGSWTGVLGQIVRHEVDLTTSFGPQLYSRSRNVDITVPVIVDNIVIMVPYPQQHSDILDMFDMFSPLFWTSFIAVNFIVGYAIYCVAFLKRAEDKHVLAYQNVLMKGVGITLGQAVPEHVAETYSRAALELLPFLVPGKGIKQLDIWSIQDW
ncbi:hypothetical protein OUZ56_015840 [Daphnia magna]|uniref:Ionotropic glutamate receptor L-glutamate and glycine-binding domain-containing protein n=1 Tax=Daphnia magna TaxID=35525 RepID=A0ABR0ANW5_9CRUS|nr:hypothetical protein OUZ56_015840 [Daphnia magna]